MGGDLRVAERGRHGNRCAYCHGALDEPLVRCASCHVECHADCAHQLGRCPTLGCEAATIQAGSFAPLVSAMPSVVNGASATGTTEASASGANATGNAPALTLADVPGVRLAGMALLLAVLSVATLVPATARTTGSGATLLFGCVLFLTTQLATFGVGLRFFRILAALPSLRSLLRDTPVPGKLHVTASALMERGRQRYEGTLTLDQAPASPIPIPLHAGWDEPWLLHRQTVRVDVRGAASPRPFLETAAGHRALVARVPRSRRKAPIDPTSVKSRTRRGWRS